MKNVNIINGLSCFYTMKESKVLNNIILFDAFFTISNIDNIDDYEIILPKEIFDEEIIYKFKDEMKKIDEAVLNNDEITIWTSNYDLDSYMLFLYLCNYLKDKNVKLYVTFSDEIKNEDGIYPSVARLNLEKLENLFLKRHKLDKEKINDYANTYQDIIKKQGDMRIIEEGLVKVVSFDYYNDTLINLLKDLKEVRISTLTANFMFDYNIKDMVVLFLINRLIKQGKIKITKESSERYFQNYITLV